VLNEPDVLLLDEPTASLDPDIGDRHADVPRALPASHRLHDAARLASHGRRSSGCATTSSCCAKARWWTTGLRQELLARYGRENMEEVFLDVARGRNDERVPGGAAVETAA
jgi:ABC-2 type transport system ATP-binding protein